MTDVHAGLTGDYFSGTQSVLYAARRLRDLLSADKAAQEYAATRLERTAQQQEDGGGSYRAFMFSELEAAAEPEKEMSERTTEDVLATILIDAQVGNVLMAAGQTMGETGEKMPPRLLDESLLRLENTTRAVEQSLSRPLAEGVEPGRFGFAEEAIAQNVVKSNDLTAAIETFNHKSQDALNTLVNEAQGALTSVITGLSNQDPSQVLTAISNLGKQVQYLPRTGRLFRQGLKKLTSAIDALIRLLGSEPLIRIKDKVKVLWQKVEEGSYITQALEKMFEAQATRAQITEILSLQELKQEVLDEASTALVQLEINFKENMAIIRSLAATIGLAAAILAVTSLMGPGVALAIVSAYVVIMAAVILIGRDYTDSGRILQRVRGVGEIANSVRPTLLEEDPK
jgi:hypothetical protein